MGVNSEPRQGIHSIRVFDVAIVDVILTLVAAYIISPKYFIGVFIVLVILSIIIHTKLGIVTRTNAWIAS